MGIEWEDRGNTAVILYIDTMGILHPETLWEQHGKTAGMSWEYARNKNTVGILGEYSGNSTITLWEYYWNDAGAQVDKLAASVYWHYLQNLGVTE